MSYWNKYGLAPFGENEILNLAIYSRLDDNTPDWLNRDTAKSSIENHTENHIICYPPNKTEGFSHDNQLGLASLVQQFNLSGTPDTNATLAQRIAFRFFNFPILWQLLGIITCLRDSEKDWAGRDVARTSGIRLLWLRCQITGSMRTQRFYQMLLKRFNPHCPSFGEAFRKYLNPYGDDEIEAKVDWAKNHPLYKLSYKADI
jgi:hypothetical protein